MAVVRSALDSSLAFRLKGTVITQIWPQIVLLNFYTFVVLVIHSCVHPLNFQLPFLSVLGVVTGMLLGFRSNTAYDRYYEGRRLWSSVKLHVRHLTRCISLGVNPQEKDERPEALGLLIAFVYATKNYLRKDYSREEPILSALMPKVTTRKSTLPSVTSSKVDDENAYDVMTPTNIPLELTHQLFLFIKQVNESKMADGSTVSAMYNSVTSLVEVLTGFERIQRTPMPRAYNVHLHQTVWLYLLLLPYQFLEGLGWWTVATMPLVAFAFLGILALGQEIEKPFGLDANDLPLEQFCHVIRQEVQLMADGQSILIGKGTETDLTSLEITKNKDI